LRDTIDAIERFVAMARDVELLDVDISWLEPADT
jgi:hypothetical protein